MRKKAKKFNESFTCGVVLEKKEYEKLQKVAVIQQPSTTASAIIRMLISNYLKQYKK